LDSFDQQSYSIPLIGIKNWELFEKKPTIFELKQNYSSLNLERNLAQIFLDKDFEQNHKVCKNTGLTKFQIILKIQYFLTEPDRKATFLSLRKKNQSPI